MWFKRRSRYPILPREPLPLGLRVAVVVIALLFFVLIGVISYYHWRLEALRREYLEIEVEKMLLTERLDALNKSLSSLYTGVKRYCCIPEVFEYVLNYDELINLLKYINTLDLGRGDVYEAITEIYEFTVVNVIYVEDQEVLIPVEKTCERVDRNQYCYYEFKTMKEIVQSPLFTLERRAGDCEDMAILTYALLEAYLEHHVVDENKTTLFITMMFNNGENHAAVLVIEHGVGLTIVDPAGRYLTRRDDGRAVAREISMELSQYNKHWSSKGGIRYVKAYEIDMVKGTHRVVFEGSLNKFIEHLEKLIHP